MSVPQEIIDIFVDQSREYLEIISARLVDFERGDAGGLDEIMRLLHTIKGGSSMLGFHGIRDLAHGLESLFQALKKNSGLRRQEINDILFESCDELLAMVNRVADNKTVSTRLSLDLHMKIQHILEAC